MRFLLETILALVMMLFFSSAPVTAFSLSAEIKTADWKIQVPSVSHVIYYSDYNSNHRTDYPTVSVGR